MKKIYKKPRTNLVSVEPTSLLDASIEFGGTGGGNTAEAKRQTRIIIDDEEEDEWEDY